MSNSRFKFRAWEKDLQFMRTFQSHKDGVLYASGDFQVSSGYDSYDEPTFSYDTDDKYIIMQWTGLKDLAGKDIYEGDILTDGTESAACLWFQANALFVLHHEDNIPYEEVGPASEVDESKGWVGLLIAGNIYENSL